MGCSSSKKVGKPTSVGDKTLLQSPMKEEDVKEVVCKSCGGNGKDIMGRKCTCPSGQAFPSQSVPVKVMILSARGLRNADWVGKSDPYCTLEVSGKHGLPGCTNVVDNNMNPEWNAEIVLGHYCLGDSITFFVRDNDPLKKDDPLGQVTVTSAQFFEDGFEGELQLSGDGTGSEAFLKVRIQALHPRVTVRIVSARGLRNADWTGKSDPYCVCEIPGRADSKTQTKAVTDQLAPVWRHSAAMPTYHAEDALRFSVKDSDPLKQDDVLGSFTLTQDLWFALGSSRFSGEVQLVDAGAGRQAFLTIDVYMGEQPSDLVIETADPGHVILLQGAAAPRSSCC